MAALRTLKAAHNCLLPGSASSWAVATTPQLLARLLPTPRVQVPTEGPPEKVATSHQLRAHLPSYFLSQHPPLPA